MTVAVVTVVILTYFSKSLDNRWDVLGAALCDSRDVFNQFYLSSPQANSLDVLSCFGCPLRLCSEPRQLETSGQRVYRSNYKTKNTFLGKDYIFLVWFIFGCCFCFSEPDSMHSGVASVAIGIGDRWRMTCDMWHTMFFHQPGLVVQWSANGYFSRK